MLKMSTADKARELASDVSVPEDTIQKSVDAIVTYIFEAAKNNKTHVRLRHSWDPTNNIIPDLPGLPTTDASVEFFMNAISKKLSGHPHYFKTLKNKSLLIDWSKQSTCNII
jgi:hypothetical protein